MKRRISKNTITDAAATIGGAIAAGFVATDPDPGIRPIPVAPTTAGGTGFQISPMLLVGGAAVLFLLLNKKK